jgi:hypothetical protein
MFSPLRRLRSSLGLALVLATNAVAQEPGAESKQTFEAIHKELEQEFRDLRAATKGLPEEEVARIQAEFFGQVLPDFAERFAELGRAERGTQLAYDSWSQIVSLATMSNTSSERGTALLGEALSALTTDHAQSEALAGLAGNLRYGSQALGEERVVQTLKDIAARTPHRTVKAAALYSLGAVLGGERATGDPRLAEAKVVFAELQKDFADVKLNDERSYAEAASAFVFALENLAVGRPCPDFAAVDAEGANFQLSDYKGKVVLVDFWGFW